MITCNLDTADGLVNRAMCYLRKITYSSHRVNAELVRPLVLWVEFDSEQCGRNLRQQETHFIAAHSENPH